jgi:hypothetical protein
MTRPAQMLFGSSFLLLAASQALTGLTELQEYCGVLFEPIFESDELWFLLDSHRRSATGFWKSAS